eukprot:scaffold130682_cov44-Attheya_sp.AAC.1
MVSVDAAGSCGSNPGQRFGIGRLVVEERIILYRMLHGPLLWSVGSGRVGSLGVFQCAQPMRLVLSVRTLQSEILLQSPSNPSFCVEYSLSHRIASSILSVLCCLAQITDFIG